jgi:anti-anti-sigma factor
MSLADVSYEVQDGVQIAHVTGELDMSNGDDLRIALERAITHEAVGVVLDLAEVTYLDSTGIHLLFDLIERVRSRGQGVRLVVCEDSPVEDALRYAGVLELAGTTQSSAEAVAELVAAAQHAE